MELLEISWPSHRDYLYDQIYKLFNAEDRLDFEMFVNAEKAADSPSLKAHSFILQIFCQSLSSSDHLRQFRFEDEEIKKDDVWCLLEFIYRGRTYVELERLEAVKKAAEKLQLKTFIDLVEGVKIEDEENVEVFYEHENKSRLKSRKDEFLNVNNCSIAELKKEDVNSKVTFKKSFTDAGGSSVDEEKYKLHFAESESLAKDFDKKYNLKPIKIHLLACDNFFDKYSAQQSELNGVENGVSEDKSGSLKDEGKKLEKKEKQLKLLSLEHLINSCESFLNQNKSAKTLVCSVCEKEFKTLSIYKKHQESHLKARNYCSLCPYKGRNLEAHMALKHQTDLTGKLLEKSVKCDRCEYVCVADFVLKIHKKKTHECLALKCEECDFSCASKSDLNRHKRVKHSKKMECEKCGKKCNRYSMKKHLLLHDEVERLKKFKCTLCAFLSRYRFNLKVHLKKIHGKSDEEVDALINSEQVRVSPNDLKDYEDDPEKIRRCFKGRRKTVRRRRILGEGAKKKVCEICGLVLSGWSTLYRHKRLHKEGDELRRRYKCPECDFQTREKFNLRSHCVKKHHMSDEQFNSIFSKPTANVTVETIENANYNLSDSFVATEVEIASSIISVNCVVDSNI